MTLQTPYFLGATGTDAAILYTAREMRLPADATFFTEGVCGPGQYAVTQRAAGANQSVDIAPGIAVVQGDVGTAQGKFLERNDGTVNTSDASVTIPDIPTSGTRRHVLGVQINDKQAGGGATSYDAVFKLVQDTSGSGALPALPGSFLALAEIRRVAGQSEGQSVTAAKIFPMAIYAGTMPATVGRFDFWGGHNQPVNRAVNTVYAPSNVRPPLLGCTVADPHLGVVTNLLPGSWLMEAEAKLGVITAGFRQVEISLDIPGGTTQRTEGIGALGGAASGSASLQCHRVFTIPSGCTATCRLYQDVTAVSHNDDGEGTLHFTGYYLGPVPGFF